MLREVQPRAALTPGHRVDLARHLPGGGWALAAFDGTVTVTDPVLTVERRVDLGMRIGDLRVACDGTWAWVGDSGLWTGTPEKPRPGPERTEAVLWTGGGLWTARTGEEVAVELRDPDFGVLAAASLPERYGGSGAWLHPHPDPGTVVLWTAGPVWAGSEAHVVTRDGDRLRVEPIPFENPDPPVFLPGGGELLVALPDLLRVSWPGGSELARLPWTDISPDPKDERPTRDLWLLPGGKAAWGSYSRRVRIVDLATMTVEAEVVLAGHPVRTFSAFHAVPGIGSPHGDLSGFTVGGAGVLSVHHHREALLSDAADWAGQPAVAS
ncbi:hypothetical protein [Phytomonospora endophytica]|uniref:Uncharacterized protein n=1 Tax=Phytomonospora endophytica TaxID=714109 RepID=A0A841FZR6_9ACTN|nr:hypothetical protein [Phytomonospora endophytica]MBB6039198.1 hypothetical protein [Phytomonospora endophytica]GIG67565.1 hypothetical protein Pen01_38600 [Phytomonospora endophytica]